MRRMMTMTALTGAMVLAGCAEFPDLTATQPRGPAPVQTAPPPPAPSADIGVRRSAGAAEAACVAQGEMQGMNVQSVVGTREVAGVGGEPGSRDVMLRVARGQQVFDVRCSYSYATAEARIMTL
jgi:hypothetical protein